MSKNKVHSHGNVPFSWEKKPGESKVGFRAPDSTDDIRKIMSKLPPPPCPPESARASFHDLQIPLPPCAFQPPLGSSCKKSIKKQDDPFLMAYKKCTKSFGKGKGDVGLGLRKSASLLSCKHSCSVSDDNIVRISHLPISKSQKEREIALSWKFHI